MSRDIVGRPMEILLVEDSLEDAGLTIRALKEGQVECRVSLVRDGEEAMVFLHREGVYAKTPRPDLILLDLQLPKKDGREVLAEVRGDEQLRNIPVVVLTASQVHEEILKSENLEVDSYMVKPVDLKQFISVVKNLRRFWLDEVILPPLE
jgi:chemotaxis family two-component system response regulator Rcp1